MKFNKGQRNINFAADNYFPAPGHYLGNDKRYSQSIKAVMNCPNVSDSAPTFTREPRFKQKKANNSGQGVGGVGSNGAGGKPAPGPGSYEIKSHFYLDPKKQQQYEQAEQLRSKESKSLFQVNAIPSIPSGHGTAGYQQIGEGLLILMKDNRKDYREEVGPGSYNLSQAAIKPKVPAYSIPKTKPVQKKSDDPVSIDVMLVSESNPPVLNSNRPPGTQGLTSKGTTQGNFMGGIGTPPGGTGHSGDKQFSNQQLEKKVRAQQNLKDVEMLVQEANQRRVPPGEFNLELLVLREKMLARGNEVPPPGYYFDPKKASTFKVAEVKPEMQCFNSSVHRFEEGPKETPGPGQYDILHVSDINPIGAGIRFGTGPKGLNLATLAGGVGVPGPGNYQIKDGIEVEIRENKATHPAVFGSGAARIGGALSSAGELSSNVGPGSYNLPGGFQQKRQKVRTVIVQQYNGGEGQNSTLPVAKAQGGADGGKNNRRREEELTDTSSKSHFSGFNYKDEFSGEGNKFGGGAAFGKKGNSVFESKIPRFQEPKINDQFIGPGTYQTPSILVPETFNRGADLFAKSERKFGLKDGKPCVPKKIGPGFYDPNIDPTRQKQTRDIHFK